MNQKELTDLFRQLSKKSAIEPNNDEVRAQIWAVLFEVLGRTTRKYPHLAQQFALIANDLCIDAPAGMLQLATGEGKSHFVAMRAARNVGMGKLVDVCTAKRSLAERDLKDYQAFFDYLNIKTAYIHPKSKREEYEVSQVHYTTMGDLSLFLDEQSYSGKPIQIEKNKRVGLFDEFDFIRFEEGLKTEYNYARPSGKTPHQMTWFYQAINNFYTGVIAAERLQGIDKALLQRLIQHLQEAAKTEDQQYILTPILHDPTQLVQWLQSAYEAHKLERSVHFTVRVEQIEVNGEKVPMREIIPLTSDSQKAIGSTFSAGVHQLLAVLLNKEALTAQNPEDRAQNYHIHPESNIISSQVASVLMDELFGKKEYFSGSISAAQAVALNKETKTQILHVPTNQRDLRKWNKIGFYPSENERIKAFVQEIRACFAKKESILFSCKTDKKVLELQAILERNFNEEERKQFIFYTNEQRESSEDILKEKRNRELNDGEKHQGIGLAAAGFGRGDNVDVEAVFLFDVNDKNDLLQKGGRTARNGEGGRVFQFYLTNELIHEEARLHAVIGEKKMQELTPKLAFVNGTDEHEKRFERVMLLREYCASLESQASQGYHKIMARFSKWGMNLLGKIDDLEVRESLTNNFSFQMKTLEKRWIDVSSMKISTAEKVELMRISVNEAIVRFLQDYNKITLRDIKLIIGAEALYEIDLVVTELPKSTAKDSAVASIAAVLMSFQSELTLNHFDDRQIPDWIQQLLFNENDLMEFAQDAQQFKSFQEFKENLKRTTQGAYRLWRQTYGVAKSQVESEYLLSNIENKQLAADFAFKMKYLSQDNQKRIMDHLLAPGVLSEQERVQSVMPVLNYLDKCTNEEKQAWANDYYDELGLLSKEIKPANLAFCLQHSKAMPLVNIQALCHIVETNAPSETEFASLYTQVYKAIESAPEHRIRMLNRMEIMSLKLSKVEARAFFTDFCTVMMQFKEGKNWDVFANLVTSTEEWWGTKESSKYRQQLLTLWTKLAKKPEFLPHLSKSFLKSAIAHKGHEWMAIIDTALDIKPELLVQYQQKMLDVWDNIQARSANKKSEKILELKTTATGLEAFDIIVKDDKNKKSLKQMLMGLRPQRFKEVLGLIEAHKEIYKNHPQVFRLVLKFRSGNTLSDGQYNRLITMLHTTAKYKGLNTQLKIGRILASLIMLKESNVAENRLALMSDWMSEHNNLSSQDDVLHKLLSYTEDNTIPLNRLKLIKEAAMLTIWYKNTNASLKIKELLSEVDKLKSATINDARVAYMVQLMQKNSALLTNNSLVFTELMNYGVDASMTNTALPLFKDALELVDIYQTQNPQLDMADLIAKVRTLKTAGLADSRMKLMLQLMHTNKAALCKHQELYNALISYVLDKTISDNALTLLTTSLVHIQAYKTKHPEVGIGLLINGLDNFKKRNVKDIQLLNSLFVDGPQHVFEPLFDNAVGYLAALDSNKAVDTCKLVIYDFYSVAKQNREIPAGVFEDDTFKRWFNFDSVKPEDRVNRIYCMNLLNNQVFVTRARTENIDSGYYILSSDNNHKLLTSGFQKYIDRTQAILNQNSTKKRVLFNKEQQFALLELTNEMKLIKEKPPLLANIFDNTAFISELKALMTNYSSSFFKVMN
jgi:hypothetical protein